MQQGAWWNAARKRGLAFARSTNNQRCRKNRTQYGMIEVGPAENREAGGHRSYHQTFERFPDEEKDERMKFLWNWWLEPTDSGSKLLATRAERQERPSLHPNEEPTLTETITIGQRLSRYPHKYGLGHRSGPEQGPVGSYSVDESVLYLCTFCYSYSSAVASGYAQEIHPRTFQHWFLSLRDGLAWMSGEEKEGGTNRRRTRIAKQKGSS